MFLAYGGYGCVGRVGAPYGTRLHATGVDKAAQGVWERRRLAGNPKAGETPALPVRSRFGVSRKVKVRDGDDEL